MPFTTGKAFLPVQVNSIVSFQVKSDNLQHLFKPLNPNTNLKYTTYKYKLLRFFVKCIFPDMFLYISKLFKS